MLSMDSSVLVYCLEEGSEECTGGHRRCTRMWCGRARGGRREDGGEEGYSGNMFGR